MDDDAQDQSARRKITSEPLSRRAVLACWGLAVILLGSGIVATFVAGTGAAPAAMILFGSLFVVLGLTQRVPLSLEVGTTKFDASYEVAEAFDAGREIGVNQGIEIAINDVEQAEESGEAPHIALERRRAAWFDLADAIDVLRDRTHISNPDPQHPSSGEVLGYRGPTACNAAGVTYRQLDYWARTGLIEPTLRSSGSGSQRLYSERDVVLIRLVKRLLDAGIGLQQIRTAVAHLREQPDQDLHRVTLMSDGRSIYETTDTREVLDLLNSGKGMFGVSLGALQREVQQALSNLPAERISPHGPNDDLPPLA